MPQPKLHAAVQVDGLIVFGDRSRLRQVFSILLDNAIRYSYEQGEIRVKVDQTPEGARVSIEDDGIGIDQKDLPRIFERFYRGDNATSVAEGSGLGLPVAKAIVEAHDGAITIDSAPGKGVTAAVTLPAESSLRVVA